ncbi:MAG: alpha/beta fold hydrolase [Pyrinomonadaceae bacterium]|nr:alpha/beta fold hydrolase [Pyrinomonadaceae bacterium]
MRTTGNERDDVVFSFAEFELDAGQRSFSKDGVPITLAPKAFDTLVMLVKNAGKVLSKERMLAEIWEGSFVEENNLAQNISILRKALGENKDRKLIETVPKFGYRFAEKVTTEEGNIGSETETKVTGARIYVTERGETVDERLIGVQLHGSQNPNPYLSPLRPRTHYVQNGDVDIAYQVVGDGPIDIVFVMGWVSHLEYFWKHHLFASFLERLASFSRLILFDKRGTGLSDRVPIDRLPTLEQRMDDVRAVMDAVGSERAVLVGVSEGGPMCALFAATYPERTSGVVMFGTYAKRIWDADYPWAPTITVRNAFFDLVKRDWGKPVGIEDRAPSMAADPEFRRWWAEYLRMGASPSAAVALTKMNADIDVRDILPLVRVPTLVMHRSGDKCLKVEEGRYVAEKISGARFVELDGIDHLPFVGDQEEVLREIEDFVAGLNPDGMYDRVLATVMSIKLEDVAAFRKDKELSAKTRELAGRKLESFKGREVSYGDGRLLAAFDGPARAIRCASAIAESAASAGIAIRTGLHTGECDVKGNSIGGFAVEFAMKIADESDVGKIIVSRTVKDLVAGSGLEFEEIGLRSFDGVEGEWRMFAVK